MNRRSLRSGVALPRPHFQSGLRHVDGWRGTLHLGQSEEREQSKKPQHHSHEILPYMDLTMAERYRVADWKRNLFPKTVFKGFRQ